MNCFLPKFSICIHAFIVEVVDSTVDLSSVLIIYLYLFGENILNIYQSVEKQDGGNSSPRVFAHFSCFHVSLHAAPDLWLSNCTSFFSVEHLYLNQNNMQCLSITWFGDFVKVSWDLSNRFHGSYHKYSLFH